MRIFIPDQDFLLQNIIQNVKYQNVSYLIINKNLITYILDQGSITMGENYKKENKK